VRPKPQITSLHLGPVRLGRNDHPARALHRLTDEGRYPLGPDLQNLCFEFARGAQTELRRVEITTALEPIGLPDVHDVGDRQPALCVHRLHAAERGAGHGAAVITVPATDDDLALRLTAQRPVAPRETHERIVGFAAGAGEKHMLELRWRQLGEAPRQLDRGRIGALEKAVVVRQLQHLPIGSLGKFAPAVAECHAPQTRHAIKDAMPLAVEEIHALGTGDHSRAAPGKRACVGEGMQIMRRIERLPLGGAA
jgi:hypothetical protein